MYKDIVLRLVRLVPLLGIFNVIFCDRLMSYHSFPLVPVLERPKGFDSGFPDGEAMTTDCRTMVRLALCKGSQST